MVTRRSVLGALTGAAAASEKGKAPNFVFLLADDHAGYVLGCDGNRQAATPNLDRLASQGVRFARHYCNSPMCTPSRQAIFTGQLPHMAGVTLLTTPLPEDKPTLARQLRKSGYQTAVFGKMHFQRRGYPGMFGLDTAWTEDIIEDEWRRQVHPRAMPAGMRTKPVWRPFHDPARIWLNAEKLPFPRYEDDMKGTFITRQAGRYLEERRKDGRPFALWVSFMEPHSPYDFPVEDCNRFNPANFPPPRVGPEDPPQIPAIFEDLSDAEKRGIIASYHTSVGFLDRNIGRVLTRLAELGLDRDTFVVYSADHGYCLGQHGRFEKHCGYDPALRVPLMMRWPGRIKPGVIRDFTEHVDVPATILDMLEAEALPVQHGRSLRPYLEGRHMAQARDHIFSEYMETEQAYIRTERYKFIYCSGRRTDWYKPAHPYGGRFTRLYDLKEDPGEFRDIAARHPDLVRRFEAMLLDRFRKTHPDASNEPPRLAPQDVLDYYVRPRDAAGT
ncbi:MAG: sulfatase-like hydrolase/transferase [Acidobacteria bacterium]|nr:sulfatase-like hydrolase/transferase [Acidobacteriota bacterium]